MGGRQTNKEIVIIKFPLKHYNSTLLVQKLVVFDLHLRKKRIQKAITNRMPIIIKQF